MKGNPERGRERERGGGGGGGHHGESGADAGILEGGGTLCFKDTKYMDKENTIFTSSYFPCDKEMKRGAVVASR